MDADKNFNPRKHGCTRKVLGSQSVHCRQSCSLLVVYSQVFINIAAILFLTCLPTGRRKARDDLMVSDDDCREKHRELLTLLFKELINALHADLCRVIFINGKMMEFRGVIFYGFFT
jgi:hypothetical protein